MAERTVGSAEEEALAAMMCSPVPVYTTLSQSAPGCFSAAVVYRQARLASDGHTFVASHYRITSGAGGRPAVERVGNDMEVPGAACRASHGDLALTATDGDGGPDAVVRVTSRGAVVAEVDTSTFSKPPHARAVGCAQLGGACVLRRGEEALALYVAQLPAPEPRAFGRAGPSSKGWESNPVAPADRGWGEQLESTEGGTGLFLLRAPGARTAADPARAPERLALPPGVSPSQPQLVDLGGDRGAAAVFTGWGKAASNFPGMVFDGCPASETRLGAIYCMNRPCGLYAVAGVGGPDSQPGEAVLLTPSLKSAHSPRVSPDGRTLVFLSHWRAVEEGVHGSSAALMMLDLEALRRGGGVAACEPTVLVPASESHLSDPSVISRPTSDPDLSFCGIYATTLPASPWLSDEEVMVNTVVRCRSVILVYNLASRGYRILGGGESTSSAAGLAACSPGCMLVAHSGPFQPPVVYAHLAGGGSRALEPGAPRAADGAASVVVDDDWAAYDPGALGPRFEAILLRAHPPGGSVEGVPAEERRRRPLVLVPHGGPHSASTTAFSFLLKALASSGCDVFCVNYRGSLGFGDAPLLSLPGKIGSQDVGDCVLALDAVLAALAAQDGGGGRRSVAVFGGSHGGFLGAHLMGQHGGRFACAIIRNPVVNLGTSGRRRHRVSATAADFIITNSLAHSLTRSLAHSPTHSLTHPLARP